MILDVLDAMVKWLFTALEKLIDFFEELIPLLLQLLFAVSPFALSTFMLYVFFGKTLALSVGTFFLLIIIIGAIWALRNPTSGSNFPGRVIIYVLIFNVAVIAAISWKKGWIGGGGGGSAVGASPADQNTQLGGEQKKSKEEVYLALLKESIEKKNTSQILTALAELRKMKSQAIIPHAVQLLRDNYPSASSYDSESWSISTAAIDTLVVLETQEGCELLYEIQVKSSMLSYKAQEAITKICASS